jgi:regulator of protease activity HflC (stomatin/prohibitin superfamily)
MDKLSQVCKYFVIAFVSLLILRGLMIHNVEMGHVGVRRSNVGGVLEQDLAPGWRLEVTGLHKVVELPSTYQFLDFTDAEALEIRTKDNNIVSLDISLPYRITPGQAHEIVEAGNHVEDGKGGYRFQRLTRDTTIGVLREHLADLQSSDFYDTDRRAKVANRTLELLNERLEPLHVEANAILIRSVFFPPAYEQQLMQIQLNAQNKLLDGARKQVADKQQELDNYQQRTNALSSSRAQSWRAKLARIDRGYQVGFLGVKPAKMVTGTDGSTNEPPSDEPPTDAPPTDTPPTDPPPSDAPPSDAPPTDDMLLDEEPIALTDLALPEPIDTEPGAARRKLENLSEAELAAAKQAAAQTLGGVPEDYGDAYLLGIKNIQAETLAYDQRVRAEADGVSARLDAEGEALVAEVVGAYESKINKLLDSPAGRAFVAWQAAANVKFAPDLTFQSDDGVPSVLRLRELAEAFMGVQ